MKKIQQEPQDKRSIDILKGVAKRVEEATVDIYSIKYDVKAMKLDMGFMQSDFAIMKVDMEKMRVEIGGMKKDIKEVKKNTEGLIETTAHILKEAVTHDERNDLSQRVSALEQS